MQSIMYIIKTMFSHGISDREDGVEFILLLRIQSVLYTIYFLALSFMLAATRHYILTFFVLAGASLLCISYIVTMNNRLHLSLVLLTTTFWILAFFLSIFAGFDYHFYWILVQR